MRATIALLFFASAAWGQALTEHAAAAAGAAIGVGAGKVLSSTIDSVLGKAAEAASKPAAKPVDQKKQNPPAGGKTEVLGSGPVSGFSPSAIGASEAPRRVARRRAESEPPVVFAPSEANSLQLTARPLEPVERVLSPADFDQITVGEAADQVLAALGPAASHITIPEDGHLLEILSYRSHGERVATVRLDNGQVASVAKVAQ